MFFVPVVNLALKNETVRETIIRQFADTLSGTLQSRELSISLDSRHLSINGKQVYGKLFDETLEFIVPSGKMTFRYSSLLRGSFFPDVLTADSPTLTYSPAPGSSFILPDEDNWGAGINGLIENIFGKNTKLHIINAEIQLADTHLHGLSVSSSKNSYQTTVDISTTLEFQQHLVPVKITGSTTDPFGAPFSYNFDFNIDEIPLNLLPKSVDFFFSGGIADLTGKVQGQKNKILLSGKGSVSDLDMSVGWTSEDGTIHQEKSYEIKNIALKFQGDLVQRAVKFSTVELLADDFHILGSIGYDMTNLNDPFLDVRIRTKEMQLTTLKMLLPDPLINDWTTRTIFPRLENGTARIDNLVLSGRLSEISSLDTPEHAGSLSWSGMLYNVDTFYNDHQPLAKVHTTRLGMDGDVLKIEEMEADSGKSILNRGDVILAGLYNPSFNLYVDIDGSFSSSWLMKLAKAGLIGEEIEQRTVNAPALSGQVQGTLKINMDISESINLRTLEGSGASDLLKIQSKKTVLPLTIKKSTFTLKYPGTSTIKGKGAWGKSRFSGTARLYDLDKKEHLSLKLQADMAELKTSFTDSPLVQSLAPCIGKLPVTTDLTLEKNIVTARGKADFSKIVKADKSLLCSQILAENSLKEARYTFKIQGKSLQVKDIHLVTDQGFLQGSGTVLNKKKKPFSLENIRLRADNFPLRAVRILLPDHNRWLTGSVFGDLRVRHPDSSDIFGKLSGTFRVQGWHGKLDYPDLTVTNANIEGFLDKGKITLSGKNIRLKKFTLDSPIRFKADLEKKEKWKGSIRVYSNTVDMSDIPSLFRHGKTRVPIKIPIDRITLLAGVDHAWYNNIVFSPMYLHTEITANRIFVSQGVIKLNQSFIWLSGILDEKSREVSYESYFMIRGQPFATILDLFGFENKRISGILDLEGKIVSTVLPDDTVFEKSIGAIYFESRNGIIRSSSTLMKILDLVSLENIFDKKEILQWKDSFKYNLIQGRFDLADSIFTTQSVIMDAPVLDVFAEGRVDVPSDMIDMQVKLAPFGTISRFLSSIPFIGFVVTGKTKSLFDYTLSVKGKIENPDVRYIPLAGTFESLTGYIKRLVTSREEIKKEVNDKVAENLSRQRKFIQYMKQELAALSGKN
jgi:hypothetical protein